MTLKRTLNLSIAIAAIGSLITACDEMPDPVETETPGTAVEPTYDMAIVNARLLDGTGAAPVEGATVVIDRDRIIEVTQGPVDAAQLIDADGRAVTPGLTDAHVHSSLRFLIPDEVLAETMEDGYPSPEYSITSDEDMQDFIDNDLRPRMMEFLESGLTTIVDPGAYFPFIVQIRDMERSGEMIAPRMFVSGRLFTAPGGHPASTVCNSDPWCVEHITVATEDPEVAREGVRMLVDGGVDGLKLVYDDGSDWGIEGGFPRLSLDVLQAVVDEGHKQGVKVTAHVSGVEETVDSVLAGVDALVHAVEPNEDGSYDVDGNNLIDLLVRHDVPVVTTVGWFAPEVAPPEERERAMQMAELTGSALKAQADHGVTLIFGTDYEGIGMDPDPRSEKLIPETSVLRIGGFDEMEIFQMLTANAARHPLTPESIGTIEPGKFADILIVEGDPLVDVTTLFTPTIVIKGGQVVVDNR